ncbi:MAG: hypothetical protein JGK32_33620 [Microcoleus sp. PH2017_31_RDM_U_A]|nr:hypothetical protein [Microcoleus sp. PH2017_31_RDM_U_A]
MPERLDRCRDITKELANVGISLAPNSVEIFPAVRPETAEFQLIQFKVRAARAINAVRMR